MEERGSSMTDGTPLVNVRRALTRMKQEVFLFLFLSVTFVRITF